jgi:hypothetical protein
MAFFPTRLDEWSFRRWYVILGGPFIALLALCVVQDGHTVRCWKITSAHDLSIALDGFAGDCWKVTFAYALSWRMLVVFVGLCAMVICFRVWTRRVPDTLDYLLRQKKVVPTMRGTRYLESILYDYQQFLLTQHRRLRLIVISIQCLLCFAVALGSTLRLHRDPANPDQVVFYSTLRILQHPADSDLAAIVEILMYVAMPSFWVYFVAIAVWVLCATGWYIRDLMVHSRVNVQMNHPDRCGGFLPLGCLLGRMAFPIALGTVTIIPYLLFSEEYTPYFFLSALALAIFVLPLIVFFLLALLAIHNRMESQKAPYELEYTSDVLKLEREIRRHLEHGDIVKAKSCKDELDIRQAFHPDRFPVWPFNGPIWTRVLLPQVVPVVSLAVKILPGALGQVVTASPGSLSP